MKYNKFNALYSSLKTFKFLKNNNLLYEQFQIKQPNNTGYQTQLNIKSTFIYHMNKTVYV